MFALKLFGCTSIETPAGPLTGRAVQRHRLALLALLAASPSRGMSRDKLIAYLWPEANSEKGRHLLSDSVYRINRAVGEDAIFGAGNELRLDPARLRSDVAEFREAAGRGEWERAVAVYAGRFLDGFFLANAPEFENWMEAERDRLDREFARALEALAEAAENRGDRARAAVWWRALVDRDPYNSRVASRLMQALDAAGERAGAIQHASEHTHRLRVDLDLEPDPEVVALAERLRGAAARREPAPRASGREGSSSIAVLPFLNLSAEPEKEYFADGITEDVIAHLSKIRALKVISRTSVMAFKQRQHTLREIGSTLGATILLDGTVRHAGDRVRIVATLIDVDSDRHLWAETYDRQVTDIFAIQTDVALQISAALEAELSPDEQARVQSRPTSDLHAYQLFLHGRQWNIRYSPESLASAIDYFDRAIARDPTFALAFAHKAMAYTQLAEDGSIAPEVGYQKATEAAAAALRLDPELDAAHCAMGYLKGVSQFDWSGAEQAFRRALELNPSSADTCDLYGRLCAGLGRYDDAIALLQRAQDLDPLAHRLDVVTVLLRAGRNEEAVARAEEAVELDPGDVRARATLGWAYFLTGSQSVGLAEMERAVSVSPGNTLWLGQLGEAYALAGMEAMAREVLRELEERAKDAYVSPYHFAYVYTGLGDAEGAIDCLERAVAERTGPVFGIGGSFLFAPLREHPRFRALLRQMKLE